MVLAQSGRGRGGGGVKLSAGTRRTRGKNAPRGARAVSSQWIPNFLYLFFIDSIRDNIALLKSLR